MPKRSTAFPFALYALTALLAFAQLAGCTLVRYRDRPSENNTEPPEPTVVDVLVIANIDRSAAPLAPYYDAILENLAAGLALKNVAVRQVALAPMYQHLGQSVPLLFGANTENSAFSSPGEAITFYTMDDNNRFLEDQGRTDGENLAALGLELDTTAIYRPDGASPESRAYFAEPADGFVVLYLSSTARRCAAQDAACQLDDQAPEAYFTKTGADGSASWLDLGPDAGLPPHRIFHLAVATSEGTSYDSFVSACRAQPQFPTGLLDALEPSEKRYFGPLADGIANQGGQAATADLCEALSTRGTRLMLGMAGRIADMTRRGSGATTR